MSQSQPQTDSLAARVARRIRRAFVLGRGPRQSELRAAYLGLLERAVTHTLYHPTDSGELPEFAVRAFEEALEGHEVTPMTAAQKRAEGRDLPAYAQTMVGVKRLRNVRQCVERVLLDGVPGDLIEAGCWRGGVAITMRGVLAAYGVDDRIVWAADSFRGVPPPDPERYPADSADLNYTTEDLAVSAEEVRENFRRYGLLDDQVRLLEGWFKDTLPTVSDRRWAVIRLDGDLYESTIDALESLYPRLSPGGYLIVDDYAFDNCRAAVEDYRGRHGIEEPIERIDWTGAYWRRRL